MWVAQSCLTIWDPRDCSPPGSSVSGLLQARLLEWVAIPFSRGSSQPRDQTQGLPHCRWILYQLSHKGSPRILEWVAYPFSSGSSRPRSQTRVSCITGRFFTNWAIKEAPNISSGLVSFILNIIYKSLIWTLVIAFFLVWPDQDICISFLLLISKTEKLLNYRFVT